MDGTAPDGVNPESVELVYRLPIETEQTHLEPMAKGRSFRQVIEESLHALKAQPYLIPLRRNTLSGEG